MRQLLLDRKEIVRIVDVASTTYYYLLQSSMINPPSTPQDNISPPSGGWTTTEPDFFTYQLTEDTEIVPNKQYYTRSETEPYTYTLVTNPVVEELPYYERVYGDTKSLYVTVQTVYTDGSCHYTQPSLSSSYEAAKVAYNRAQSAMSLAGDTNQHFWYITSSMGEGIPAGAYVTERGGSDVFARDKQGGNIVVQSSGITIRNGIVNLASLTGQSLNFYNPQYNTSAISIGNYGILLKDETGQEVASFNQDGIEFSSSVAQKIGGQNNYITFDPVTDNITISGSNINFEPLNKLEDVVGTSEWIERHGNYILTTDTAVQDRKIYYRQNEYVFHTADSEVDTNKIYYTAVITEVETPIVEDIELYFELQNGQYMQTHDIEIDETKTYYTVDLTYVEEPSTESLSTYYEQVFNYQAITAKDNPSEQNLYELQFDDVVSNYINTHLSLTNEGLYVLSDEKAFVKTRDTEIISTKEYYTRTGTEGNYTYTKVENPVAADISLYFEQGDGYKVLLSSQDLRIIDSTGITTATYGDSIGFDSTREFAIGNENVYIKYFDSDNDAIADSIAIKADEIIFGGASLGAKLEQVDEDVSGIQTTVNQVETSVSENMNAMNEAISGLNDDIATQASNLEQTNTTLKPYTDYIIIDTNEPSIKVAATDTAYLKIMSVRSMEYVKTEDSALDATKTYYTRSGSEGAYTYTAVAEPTIEDIESYYEYKQVVTSKLQLVADNNEVAYLSNERLYAPSAVVNNLYMQTVDATTGNAVGAIGWVMRSNGHLSMRRMK